MRHIKQSKFWILFLLVIFCGFSHSEAMTGKVVDQITGQPVKNAIVTSGSEVVVTDDNGIFVIQSSENVISARAYGYLRNSLDLASGKSPDSADILQRRLLNIREFKFKDLFKNINSKSRPENNGRAKTQCEIPLKPFTPKALYLTVYGIGSTVIRGNALKLIDSTELNALVIDVKGDRGFIPYKSSVSLAAMVGGQKVMTVKDMQGMIKSLKEKNIYLIARIVTFKDNLLANAKPDLAIRARNGAIFADRENLRWVDPTRKEVWEYNIQIAEEAAILGFDEIQFDYVRFPDAKGLKFSQENTEENRVKAITGFLAEARRRLIPYNVFLGADIFGYVFWNPNDTSIGQRLEDVSIPVEYICPMMYPSGFQFGIPGYRNPIVKSYEVILLTLQRGKERTGLPPIRFRPWLQAFRDYAFDRRHFKAKEIRDQIRAAEDFGSNGWMLWNPKNVYTAEGLKGK
jgi:hypothetical protein